MPFGNEAATLVAPAETPLLLFLQNAHERIAQDHRGNVADYIPKLGQPDSDKSHRSLSGADTLRPLRDVVSPETDATLIRQGDNDLGVWCAAASTGKEPYSITVTMLDFSLGAMPAWTPVYGNRSFARSAASRQMWSIRLRAGAASAA